MSSTSKQKQKTQYLNSGQLLKRIRQLDAIRFGEFTITLFKGMGYEIQTTSTPSDKGISLVLRDKNKKLTIAECSRDETLVDQFIVKDLHQKMVRNKVNEAYLVTTGTIDISAQQWAAEKPIHLIDGKRLAQLVQFIKDKKIKKTTTKKSKNKKFLAYFSSSPMLTCITSAVLLLLACCFLFSTCIIFFSIASELLPTPTATPTFTQTFTQTPTPTLTPTLTPTETWTPTETLTPTVTLTPTLTFTRTSTSTPRPTFTSTAKPTSTRAPTKVQSGFTVSQFTSPVRRGSNATVQIKTAPGASCTLRYVTPSGAVSSATGLGSKIADKNGICSWIWKISGNTRRGTGTVTITANDVRQSFSISIR